MRTLVLVHTPIVGPYTWTPLADWHRARGGPPSSRISALTRPMDRQVTCMPGGHFEMLNDAACVGEAILAALDD